MIWLGQAPRHEAVHGEADEGDDGARVSLKIAPADRGGVGSLKRTPDLIASSSPELFGRLPGPTRTGFPFEKTVCPARTWWMPSAQKEVAIAPVRPPARWQWSMALPLAKLIAPVGPSMLKTFSGALLASAAQTSATVTATLQSLAPGDAWRCFSAARRGSRQPGHRPGSRRPERRRLRAARAGLLRGI